MKQETDIAAETFKRIDSVGEAMKQLAVELKVPAGELFHALCVREMAFGICKLALMAILFASFAIAARTTARAYRRWRDENPGEHVEGWELAPFAFTLGVTSFVCLIVFAAHIPTCVGQIFAPEIYAVEAIVEMMK